MADAHVPAPGPPGLRVLVVEDSRVCAESLAALLALWGHEAEVAPDGAAAVAATRRRPPDVVLLDLGLPDMGGHEVARRLRGLGLERPPLLVAVTAHGEDADRLSSRDAGIDLHLVKPVAPADLERLLKQVQASLAGG